MGFAIMLLNTDLFNRNIEEQNRMTPKGFIRNTRTNAHGVDTENDPGCSPAECEKLYHR